MSNNSNLPKDLQKYARATFWRKSRAFIISFTLLSLILIFFGDVILPTKYPGAKVISYTIVLALPFIFTKFPFCVIDSTYCGMIERVKIKTTMDNDFLAKPMFNGLKLYDRNTIYLFIRTPDGDLIKRKVYSGMASRQEFINIYHRGDEVLHLYGTDTVVILPGETGTHVQCPVCGAVNEKENEFCRECGHTILHDLAFAWAGAAVPREKWKAEKTDIPTKIRDEYVEEKNRVYDDFAEKKKPHREEEKKSADVTKEATYVQSTAARPDSYAEARKNAILARKMREEHEDNFQKQEIAHYADHDAEAIKKAKEIEEKKEKHSFFWEFFSYFGTAVLITHAISYVSIPFLGGTFLRAEVNFFSQTLIFSAILFYRFFVFGKNEFLHKRVGRKKILVSGILALLIYAAAYAIYHGSGLLIPPARIHGDGIHALALILCGAGGRSVGEQPLRYDAVHGWIHPSNPFPQFYPFALVISFLLNAVYYIWLMWISYKFGIDERDEERRDIMKGTDTVERRQKRRSFENALFRL